MRTAFLISTLLAASPLAATALHAETLTEALAGAYQSNPALQQQRAVLRQLDETYVQARTGLRPTLSLGASGSYTHYQSPNISQGNFDTNSGQLGLNASQTLFTSAAKSLGADVVAVEGYQPDEKDFRSTLVRVRDANPDAIVLISYYADGALIARQIRTVGLKTPIVASGSVYSPKFLELAGDAANGIFTETNFFPGESRVEVQNFVAKFRARFNEDPDTFNAVAYDAIVLMAAVFDQFGTERAAIRDGLAKIKDVPSVIFGKATFDPQTRRVAGARAVYLIVKDGKFAAWDGVKPTTN